MTDRELMQQALDALERYQVKRQDFDRFADEVAALRERLAQPEQEIDWKDQYEKQKRRAEMWRDKYEAVAGPDECVSPAQPEQEPVAWRYALDASIDGPRWIYIDRDPNKWLTGPAFVKALVEPLYTAPHPKHQCAHGIDQKECGWCGPSQQAQEPVAWVGPSWLHPDTRTWESQSFAAKPINGWIPLYTAPRQWQGLTDDEINQFRQWAHPDIIKAIELKLKEKNT